MSEMTFETVAYDGKSFKPDEDGNATTPQGKRLEQLGFTQRKVADPRYDEVLVLDHHSAGRVNKGRVVVVHEDEVLGIIDESAKPVVKKAVAKKAVAKK